MNEYLEFGIPWQFLPSNQKTTRSINLSQEYYRAFSYAYVVVTRPRYGLRWSELHFWLLKMERNLRQPARRDLGEAN